MISFEYWVLKSQQQGFANLESGSRLWEEKSRTEIRTELLAAGFTADPANYKRMIYKPKSMTQVRTHKDQCITSYVCGTEINTQAFDMFLALCAAQDLEPVIVPIKYKNPTSLEEALSQDTDTDPNTYIAPEVRPFLRSTRYQFSSDIVVLADIKPQITAVNPLNGIESINKGISAVLGHITQQLKSVPRMLPDKPIIIATTGTVSDVVFGDNLAAKRAEFNIIHGCVIVSGGEIKIRHVVFNTTSESVSAVDLGIMYDLTGKKSPATSFVFLGDIHFGAEDKQALKWALNLCQQAKPECIVLNDTFDGRTVNHHIEKAADKYVRFASVAEEIYYHNQEIKKIQDRFRQVYVIQSNHNEWLRRWLTDVHPVKDLTNAPDKNLYAALLLDQQILSGEILQSGSKINGYSVFHGHEGVNGGKMAAGALMRIGSKAVYAHTHTPLVSQGVYNPGCLCELDQDYTRGGLTSWCHGVVIVSTAGKAQVVLKWE